MEAPNEPAVLSSSTDTAPAKERYQYRSLPNASQTRLLKVTARSTAISESSVKVELEQYSLQQAPPYKALSYTWGASEKPEHIIVGNCFYLNVTKNLFPFLVYLCTKKPVLSWIDAICINQDDFQERGSLVRLMKQIYQQAKGVSYGCISHR